MTYTREELIKKLHLSKFKDIALYNNSPHSQELSLITSQDYLADLTQDFDVIFVHTFTLDEMKEMLLTLWEQSTIRPGGIAYLVYPKLNNPEYPGIHRDDIFPALEVDDGLGLMPNTHYKFNKMVSLNEIFTIIGLKHLTDKELKNLSASKNNTQPSGRVSDYIQYIPEIVTKLEADHSDLVNKFQSLTPGKQRNWAREIYSARTQATQDKRWQKLFDELNA